MKLVEVETPTNTHTAAAVGIRIDDIVHIWCCDGWSDQEFDTLVRRYDLWDVPAEQWVYAVIEPPGAPAIEYWRICVNA